MVLDISLVHACRRWAREGAIAVPLYPPDPTRIVRTVPRLVHQMRDAKVDGILTNAQGLMPAKRMLLPGFPELARLEWIAVDHVESTPEDYSEHLPMASDIAYVQYTSGSTGNPNGVLVPYSQLGANSAMQAAQTGHTNPALGLWLPLQHDFGMVGGIAYPVFLAGCRHSCRPSSSSDGRSLSSPSQGY